jgi:hypothetical protein
MHEIKTEIEINAAPERVWSILMDFPSYPEWNPFIRRIEGIGEVGERLSVLIHPPGGQGMEFRPVVLGVIPNRELRWRGRVLLPGVLDGEHYFQLTQAGANRTRFVQAEFFSGLLAWLLKGKLDVGTKAGFEAMNQALRARAETS